MSPRRPRTLVDLARLPKDDPERARWARDVRQILEEDYPELIRDSAHRVKQTRANRPKRRAALVKEFQAQVGQLDKRALEKFCWMVMDDPGLLLYLQQRNLLAPITFYLMRVYLVKKPRWSPSGDEIGSIVQRLTDHLSQTRAYKVVAGWTGKPVETVRSGHRAYKKKKA